MAETVTENRLFGPTTITTSNSTKLTVASNHRAVLKQLIICNTNGIDAWVSIALNGTAATAANCFFYHLPLAAFDTLILDTQIVLEATETLQAISDQGAITLIGVGWDHVLS